MAINFEKIPSDVEIPLTPLPKTRTVLEEIIARQSLLTERTAIKCKDIEPLYEKEKKKPQRFTYKYICICPRYNPQYTCQHKDNIIIDRDILTPEEHLVYLATPKPNVGIPRKMPRYYLQKRIVPNCTARINKLALPNLKQVNETLNNFQHIIPKRHKRSLKKYLKKPPNVEYTSIQTALDWMEEEKRLRKVAKKLEKKRCEKLTRKIVRKQRSEIKKIVSVLFEDMKEFLLNDQFVMEESSPLAAVILDALREFTEKEFYITSNLQEYQKILASNLAVWINKFISNLNIQVADPPTAHCPQMPQPQTEKHTHELTSFLPVDDYISCSSLSEDAYYEDEDDDDEECLSFQDGEPTQSTDDDKTIQSNSTPRQVSEQ